MQLKDIRNIAGNSAALRIALLHIQTGIWDYAVLCENYALLQYPIYEHTNTNAKVCHKSKSSSRLQTSGTLHAFITSTFQLEEAPSMV